ncbi:uncharacterized protein LOC144376701 [Ictidomys tridecemlineatus]
MRPRRGAQSKPLFTVGAPCPQRKSDLSSAPQKRPRPAPASQVQRQVAEQVQEPAASCGPRPRKWALSTFDRPSPHLPAQRTCSRRNCTFLGSFLPSGPKVFPKVFHQERVPGRTVSDCNLLQGKRITKPETQRELSGYGSQLLRTSNHCKHTGSQNQVSFSGSDRRTQFCVLQGDRVSALGGACFLRRDMGMVLSQSWTTVANHYGPMVKYVDERRLDYWMISCNSLCISPIMSTSKLFHKE